MSGYAIVTNAYYPGGLPEYVRLTDAIKAAWCARAGWDYIRTDNPPPEPGLTGHWCKIAAVETALEGHDAVVWMDCDAAPVSDRAVDVEEAIEAAGDVILMARDCNGINSGVYSVRGPRGLMVWRAAYAMRRDYRSHPWAEQAALMALEGWAEQAALMAHPERGEWRRLVAQPPAGLGWNQYPWRCPNQYRPGDWVLHCPARDDRQRAECFARFV